MWLRGRSELWQVWAVAGLGLWQVWVVPGLGLSGGCGRCSRTWGRSEPWLSGLNAADLRFERLVSLTLLFANRPLPTPSVMVGL